MKAQHPCFKLKKPKCLHCAKNRTEGVCVSFYQPATCHFLKAAMTHSSIWQIKIIFPHKDTPSESKTSYSCDINGGKNTQKLSVGWCGKNSSWRWAGARLAVSPSGQLKHYLWATQPAHFPPSTSTQTIVLIYQNEEKEACGTQTC